MKRPNWPGLGVFLVPYLIVLAAAPLPAADVAPGATPAPRTGPTDSEERSAATASLGHPGAGHNRFDLQRTDIAAFIEHMAAAGLGRKEVAALLAKAEPQPKIIEAMSRPAEKSLQWWEYRAHFLSAERIDAGARLWREHRELLDAIAMEHHVDPEYLLGIVGVETYFGRITGHYRVLDALSTLSFDYPPRAEFFRQELEQFLLLAHGGELDALGALGSYAGAMGVAQFMPSSYRRYAVNEGASTRRDLWNDWGDILGSVANYLQEHGWSYGQPVLAEARLGKAPEPTSPSTVTLNETLGALRQSGLQVDSALPDDTACLTLPAPLQNGMSYRVGFHNFYVITRYNRSPLYAMAVHDLAQAIRARTLDPDAP